MMKRSLKECNAREQAEDEKEERPKFICGLENAPTSKERADMLRAQCMIEIAQSQQ